METIQWVTPGTIYNYLANIASSNWRIRDDATVDHWHLIYKGGQTDFDVFMDLSEEWVYFQVPMFKPNDKINPACRGAFFAYLLGLNQKMHLAKFSLDEAEQIWLQVDIPAEIFDFTTFRNAVEALAIYLEQYAAEISIVAHQPDFAGFVAQGKYQPEKAVDLGIKIK